MTRTTPAQPLASYASRIAASFFRTFAALALFAHKTTDPEDSYAYGAPAPIRPNPERPA